MSIRVPGVRVHHRRVTLSVTRPTVVTALVLSAALAGCGYKGPLSLPQPKSEGRKTPPAVVLPEPAPDRPVPSEAAPPPK